jgi:NMD protein affecting ribosome stability and mRNA decay
MASKVECPRCGGVSTSFVHGVCRACYMREYHQRRSASAATECPRCGGVSANFVHGVCRACYMREYHQRRSASAVTDRQSMSETPTFICDSEGRSPCTECREPVIYARGLCQSCYLRDRRRRHRMKQCTCAMCGASFQSARRDTHYCSLSCRQKAHRASKAQAA